MNTVVGSPPAAAPFTGTFGFSGSSGLSGLSTLERDTLRVLVGRNPGVNDTRGSAQSAFAPALARYPGNKLFAALTGTAVDRVVQRFDDTLFRDTVNNLLDMAGASPYTSLLRGAFDSADIRNMTATQRSQFLAMLSLSVASGGPNLAQTQSMLDFLAASTGCGGGSGCQGGGAFSYQVTGAGTATIDLGDGYTLRINQANSEVDLVDNNTGNTTTIWGDPHMGMNGNNNQFQFKGNVTLNLPDGTKITLQTTPWQNNPNAYLVQNVVVTRGSQAIVVDNMDQNSADLGKMTIQQYDGAGQLERLLNPDGTELFLNCAGNGWDVLQDGLFLRPLTEQDLEAGDRTEANGTATLAWELGVLTSLLGELSLEGGCEYSELGAGRR